MKAQVNKKVNSRLGAGTASDKSVPLEVGSNIEVVGLERGELYRGSSQWLVADNGNRHWAGAFNLNSGSSYFKNYGIDELWKFSHGDGVKVGILDCGVLPDNVALKNLAINQVNTQSGNTCIHGTYMAAIIGARNFTENYVGIAPGCEMLSASYRNEDDIKVDDVKSGINSLDAAQIINMSFATNLRDFNPIRFDPAKELNDIFKAKALAGKIFVASTGNDGLHNKDQSFFYPAHYDAIISVGGGFEKDGTFFIDNISNCWQGVDILGPTQNYFDLLPGSNSLFQNRTIGTSVAAALVSGILALVYAKISQIPDGLTKSKIIELIADPVIAKSNKKDLSIETHRLNPIKIKSLITQ